LLDQLRGSGDVDCAPGAARLARGYPVRVTDLIDALADAVDPPEAELFVDEFLPGDARFSRTTPVEANKQLGRCRVVVLEPGAEL
jgi:hypothetical protein